MKYLLLDNYDSFTYNLLHLIQQCSNATVDVIKNDAIALSEVAVYDKIILSPGPELPNNAGIMPQLIKQYYTTKPILGVCLGHQAIAEAIGGKLKNLEKVYHGIATVCNKVNEGGVLLKQFPSSFDIGRYHSWVVDEVNFPDELIITSKDEEGNIMSFEHKKLPLFGVQFHPESILTPNGEWIMSAFVTV